MNENKTHIAVCLDRSGSMASIASDVVGGFNKFVEDQKEQKGEATLTLAQFDDVYEIVHDFIDIQKMEGLKLVPRGSTALLDAMGQTLEDVRTKVLAMDDKEQPAKVIFVFITDGEENASSKYTRKQIFEMIKNLKNTDREDKINWEFVFIGANQDAISEGSSYGFRSKASITFDASGAGATQAFASLSKGMTSYRCCAAPNAAYSFSDEDYKAQDELLGTNKKSSKVTRSIVTNDIYKMGIIPTDVPDAIHLSEDDKV